MKTVFNHWAAGLIVMTLVIGLIFSGVYVLAHNTPTLAFAGESENDEDEYGFFYGEEDGDEDGEDGDNEF